MDSMKRLVVHYKDREMPVGIIDPDRISSFDLIDMGNSYIHLDLKEVLPINPTFYYTHPGKEKKVIINTEGDLVNAIQAWSGEEVVHLHLFSSKVANKLCLANNSLSEFQKLNQEAEKNLKMCTPSHSGVEERFEYLLDPNTPSFITQEQYMPDPNTPSFIPQEPNLPDPNTPPFITQEPNLPDPNTPPFVPQEPDVPHPINWDQLSIILEQPELIAGNNTQDGWDDWASETHEDSDYVEEEEDGIESDVSLDDENFRVTDETQVSTDEDEDVDPPGDMYRGRWWSLEPDGKIKLLQWDLFSNKKKLMDVVRDYSVQEGKYLTQLKSARYRFTAKCSHEACDWRIHSSVLQDGRTFQIKTLKGSHDWTCPLLMDNPSANSRWVFKKLLPLFKTDPKTTAKDIKKELMKTYGLHLKKHVIRAARDLLKVAVEGRHDDSYAKLASYVEMVRISNPGSVAFIQWDAPNPSNLEQDQSPRFKRIFISLAGMIEGFKKGCRPLIGVDRCHLKGPFGGVVLTAIGLDGDNHCFPLAFGIAENESNESWGWFFTALLKVVGVDEHKWYTVMSDRCKGVMNACKTYFPDASRRVCLVHLERNMIRKWGGSPELLQLMWGAANAYTDWEHQPFMDELEQKCPEAYAWLVKEPKVHWCRHKYLHKTCAPDNTSNWVESFNNVIGELRDKPVLFLLEGIRKHIQLWVAERLDVASKWSGHLVPSIVDTLRVHQVRAYQCEIVPNGHWKFDVRDTYNLVNYTVDLHKKHCDCCYWMITGIPCKHAIRCILSITGLRIEDFTSPYYTIQKFKEAYGEELHPIKDICMWPKFNHPLLLPPLVVKKKGRRSTKRRRGPEEPRTSKPSRHTSVRCKTCRQLHHNSTTCPFNTNKEPPKKTQKAKRGPRGRPTKERQAAAKEAAKNAKKSLPLLSSSSQVSVQQTNPTDEDEAEAEAQMEEQEEAEIAYRQQQEYHMMQSEQRRYEMEIEEQRKLMMSTKKSPIQKLPIRKTSAQIMSHLKSPKKHIAHKKRKIQASTSKSASKWFDCSKSASK